MELSVEFAAYVRLGYTPDTSLPDGTIIRGQGKVFTSTKHRHLKNTGELYAHNLIMRDPLPGVYKQLYVIVKYSSGERDTFIIREGDKKIVTDKPSTNNIATLQGEKGLQGPQGERGLQGIQGERGLQGERGIQGERGHQGQRGIQGPPGLPGLSSSGTSNFASMYKQNYGAITSLHVTDHNYSFLSGSGFLMLYANKPHLITAAHNVINRNRRERARKIIASFHNSIEFVAYECVIIGVASYADIAVLELINFTPNLGQHYLSWATSHPEIGDACTILGNPLGLDEASFSSGHVRDMEYYHMQNIVESVSVTAPLFSGNSGGAISNSHGEVLAIVSAGIGDYETFGWGVSYRIAKPIIQDIIQNRRDYHVGHIGLKLMLPNGYYAMQTGVTSLSGFVVRESSISGIDSGDQVVEINGEKIGQESISLSEKILLNKNSWINITIRRNGIILYRPVYIHEISEYEDIPLGRFNHELNTETKSVRRITSRAMPIAQEEPRQLRRSRQHRTLMFTTQK